MKNTLKKGIALASALLMMGMSAGCGVTDTGENCLDVYCHKAGYGVEWCKDLLKEFVKQDWVKEKYPGVSYTFNSTDQDGYVKSKIEATNNNHFDLLFVQLVDDLRYDLLVARYRRRREHDHIVFLELH
jgi:hypothetical protein